MDGFPNSRTSLLHQKLQMLNVCIDRRKARDAASLQPLAGVAETSSDSEDEFYECSDDENTSDSASENKKEKTSLWNRPVGRLAKFGSEKLLESGDQMYIPVTQEPVPKTEDQLEQDAEVMLTLETGPDRSQTIARIMSASLLSDMESFKAANPSAIFEDFIRWYSPRDWIEGENAEEEGEKKGEKKGHLSTRMLIPNNMWIDVWGSARPVPAKRQRRLFDDTKEAEKILHFFESRSVSQIVDLLLPSLTQAIIEKLGQECENKTELPQLEALFERLKVCAMKVTRERAEADKYNTLADQIYTMEVMISRLMSMQMKLGYHKERVVDVEVKKFFTDLVMTMEAQVPGAGRSQLGGRVAQLFREERASPSPSGLGPFPPAAPSGSRSKPGFPPPAEKEFVLRVMAQRPAACSAPAPQLMRAILKPNSYRILGAFTEDCIFS